MVNNIHPVIPAKITIYLLFFNCFNSFVHITCPLSDDGRMLQFIKMLSDIKNKLQVIKFSTTVIMKVKYIFFIHMALNDDFV